MRLNGKSAAITGAASGMGREAARLFAREGARVAALDVNAEGLAETAEGLENIHVRPLDLGRPEEIRDAFASLEERFGGLDILICAAGVVGSKYGDGPAAECREEAWDYVMRINLKGVWLCCKYAIPLMLERGGGSIVTISSSTAIRPPAEHFRSHAYITSKGAVITLTQAIAAAYGRQKIRANVIAPGMIDTPMSRRMQGLPEVMAYLGDRQLLGALGQAADVSAALMFLAADESKFISGQVIAVDGGWINHG